MTGAHAALLIINFFSSAMDFSTEVGPSSGVSERDADVSVLPAPHLSN